jgi:hypothetical protein
MVASSEEQSWLAVIGRALAFLCLTKADLRDKNRATQSIFLQGLGLSLKETASLLGTSEASIRELIRQDSKKKSKKKGAKSGTKKKE